GMLGTIGDLEAAKVRLDVETARQRTELQSFRVHPQYEEIERSADQLTQELHELTNGNIADRRVLALYQASLTQEREPSNSELIELFGQVGLVLPNLVIRRLDEVLEFHRQLVGNRRSFLQRELVRLQDNIRKRQNVVAQQTEARAGLMGILNSHRALDEYNRLQQRHLSAVAQRNEVETRLRNLRQLEESRSNLRIKRELLLQRARRDFDERRAQRERAITLFNTNSEALYNVPGNLVLDVDANGFRFDVEILRSGSSGIGNMKIFCYDLMLAQLWSGKSISPGVLIHDSTLFDGVDERQKALALERASAESARLGFQYICALNSDSLPESDFSPGFSITPFRRLVLTDATEDGGLLGFRY
ncbi:MAG: DUF2326 domain-containing protein, partial [Bacillota bacterium]|nr:DUF2326 domain-containing protein [Bacillota bacterium]